MQDLGVRLKRSNTSMKWNTFPCWLSMLRK